MDEAFSDVPWTFQCGAIGVLRYVLYSEVSNVDSRAWEWDLQQATSGQLLPWGLRSSKSGSQIIGRQIVPYCYAFTLTDRTLL